MNLDALEGGLPSNRDWRDLPAEVPGKVDDVFAARDRIAALKARLAGCYRHHDQVRMAEAENLRESIIAAESALAKLVE